MHNHDDDDNDKTFSWIMGLMMLCCVLPLLLVLFGGKALLSGGSRWWIGALMLVFVAWHFWSMRKGHCHNKAQEPDSKTTTETANSEQPHDKV